MLYGRFIQSTQVDKVAPFHDPLKTLKLKTLASDCVIKKDVTTMPLLIYYEQNRIEQNFIRTPIGYKAREDTIYI